MRILDPILNRSPKEEEQAQSIVVPEYTGNTIMFHYHEEDRELWYDLGQHINTLVMRLSSQEWRWKYYHYFTRKISEEENNAKHKAFMQDLEQTFLYIPCTSAPFITKFLQSMETQEDVKNAIAQTYIQPVPLRPTHGVSQSILPKPLAAYASGHERDEACAQVVATLEHKLLSYQNLRGEEKREPAALLEETKTPLLLAPPK